MRPQKGESEDGFIKIRLNNRASGLDNWALVRRMEKGRGKRRRTARNTLNRIYR